MLLRPGLCAPRAGDVWRGDGVPGPLGPAAGVCSGHGGGGQVGEPQGGKPGGWRAPPAAALLLVRPTCWAARMRSGRPGLPCRAGGLNRASPISPLHAASADAGGLKHVLHPSAPSTLRMAAAPPLACHASPPSRPREPSFFLLLLLHAASAAAQGVLHQPGAPVRPGPSLLPGRRRHRPGQPAGCELACASLARPMSSPRPAASP